MPRERRRRDFLTPLLLIAGWAPPKTAAATSIVFIAGNSLSGLIGFATSGQALPWHLASLFPLALLGGFAGSRLGSYHFSPDTIRRLLAIVLLLASVKLLSKSIQSTPTANHVSTIDHWCLSIGN